MGVAVPKCSIRGLLRAGFTCLSGLLPVLAGAVQPALEGRIDAWGMQHSMKDDLSVLIEVRDAGTGMISTSYVTDAGMNLGAGIRGLTWLADRPAWVTGLDVGYLEARGASHEMHVQPVSVFIGLQGLHTSGRRPRPYLLAGLTMYSAWGHVTAGTLSSGFRKTDWWIDGTDDLSSYLAAGFTWPLSSSWSLMLDARRQRFSFDDLQTNSIILPTRNVMTNVSLDVSGFALGISWTPGAHP